MLKIFRNACLIILLVAILGLATAADFAADSNLGSAASAETLLKFLDRLISFIQAVAWPSVALILLFWIRPYFGELSGRLRKLEIPGGTKLEFGDELAEASERLEADKIKNPPLHTQATTALSTEEAQKIDDAKFSELSKTFPQAAVLASFTPLELTVRQAAERLGISPKQPFWTVVRQLYDQDRISVDLYQALDKLRKLRNEAAHSGAERITPDEAHEFRALAKSADLQIRYTALITPAWRAPPSSEPR